MNTDNDFKDTILQKLWQQKGLENYPIVQTFLSRLAQQEGEPNALVDYICRHRNMHESQPICLTRDELNLLYHIVHSPTTSSEHRPERAPSLEAQQAAKTERAHRRALQDQLREQPISMNRRVALTGMGMVLGSVVGSAIGARLAAGPQFTTQQRDEAYATKNNAIFQGATIGAVGGYLTGGIPEKSHLIALSGLDEVTYHFVQELRRDPRTRTLLRDYKTSNPITTPTIGPYLG